MVGGELRISEGVVRAVARRTHRDETKLPPLYDRIDPGALDSLINKMAEGEVSFAYAGCKITVGSDGSIRVTDCRPASLGGVPVGSD
ncbi:MAG: HalOD1 output domain-containing protein [Halobacteriota archaeon]|uniref:HalOD1 output domain-containing protein n=1 Tax=Natronomonas sp. TaxID=2184060 RepID=UPI003975BC5F